MRNFRYLLFLILWGFSLTSNSQNRHLVVLNLPHLIENTGTQFIDYDYDGKMDIWLSGIDEKHNQWNQLFRNTTSGFQPIDIPVNGSFSFWMNLNNDPYPDVMASDSTGIYIWKNQYRNLIRHFDVNNITLNQFYSFDLDVNGFQDFTGLSIDKQTQNSILNFNDTLSVIEYPFSDLINAKHISLGISGMGSHFLTSGMDLDGNNALKEIIFTKDEKLVTDIFDPNPLLIHDLKIEDLNGNGVGEIITWRYTNQLESLIEINSIESQSLKPIQSVSNTKVAQWEIGDVDQNGLNDLVLIHSSDGSSTKITTISYSKIHGWRTNMDSLNIEVNDVLGKMDVNFDGQSDLIFLCKDTYGKNLIVAWVSDENYFDTPPDTPVISSIQYNTDSVFIEIGTGHDHDSPFEILIPQLQLITDHSQEIMLFESKKSIRSQYINAGTISIPILKLGGYSALVRLMDPQEKVGEFSDTVRFEVCKDPDIGPDITICPNEIIELNERWGQSGRWYRSSIKSWSESTKSFRAEFNLTDTLVFKLAYPGNCIKFDTLLVKVEEFTSPFAGLNSSFCEGENLEFEIDEKWKSSHIYSTLYGQIKPLIRIYNYNISLTDTLIFNGITRNGCQFLDTILIQPVISTVAEIKWPQKICENEEINLKKLANDDVNIRILHSEDTNLVVKDSILKVTQTTLIPVEYSFQNTCIVKDTIAMEMIALTPINIDYEMEICSNEKFSITIPTYSIEWLSSDNSVQSTSNLLETILNFDSLFQYQYRDLNQCLINDSIFVTVKTAPEAILNDTVYLCAGRDINLNKSDRYQIGWKFTNNEAFQESSKIKYQELEGIDTLYTLIRADNGCKTFGIHKIIAVTSPSLELSSSLTYCEGDSINLNFNPKDWASIIWQYRDTLNEGHEIIIPSPSLNDTLVLTLTDNFSCRYESVHHFNSIQRYPLNISGPDQVCPDEISRYTVNNIDTVSWFLGNNLLEKGLSGSIDISLSKNNYLVVSPLQHSCGLIDTMNINVIGGLEAEIVGNQAICPEEMLQLEISNLKEIEWRDLQGNILSTQADLNIKYKIPDQLIWSGIDSENCIQGDTVQILKLESPIIDAGPDQVICLQDSAMIHPHSITEDLEFSWVTDFGTLYKDTLFVSPSFNQLYTLIGKNKKGCTNKDSLIIFSDVRYKVPNSSQLSFCEGEELYLEVQTQPKEAQNSTFNQWFINGIKQEEANNVYKSLLLDHSNVRAILSTDYCNLDTIDFNVSKIIPKIPNLEDTFHLGRLEPISIEDVQLTQLLWWPNGYVNNTSDGNFIIKAEESTKINFKGLDTNNCWVEGEFYLSVKNELFIPQLFSPNNDGVNDTFQIHGTGIKSASLKIYNSYGSLVFNSNQPFTGKKSWNGLIEGIPAPEGTYYWDLIGYYSDGKPLSHNGTLSGKLILLR